MIVSLRVSARLIFSYNNFILWYNNFIPSYILTDRYCKWFTVTIPTIIAKRNRKMRNRLEYKYFDPNLANDNIIIFHDGTFFQSMECFFRTFASYVFYGDIQNEKYSATNLSKLFNVNKKDYASAISFLDV